MVYRIYFVDYNYHDLFIDLKNFNEMETKPTYMLDEIVKSINHDI